MKIVVVAIISRINSSGKKEYLLVSSKREAFGQHSGAYYPPGGHLEAGEDEKEALKRETKEELGIDIEPIKMITESPGDMPDQITHWWGCKIKTGEPSIIDGDEIDDVGYFTKDEMENLKLWPATKEFFKKYL